MNIFSEYKIDETEFRNRVVVPPMARGLATEEGGITGKNLDHYDRISIDAGLTIVEHSFVSEEGRYSKNQIGINKDGLVDGLSKLSGTIKDNGSVSCIQINHSGDRKTEEIKKLFSSEELPSVNSLGESELIEIEEDFVEAAIRAEEAGFDAVEIHGTHGFLLNSFLSPLSNNRKDKYGGDLDNRMRFPLKVVDSVKEELNDSILAFRLGATDLDTKGLGEEEAKQIASMLEKHGIDLLDVSGGLCGSRPQELEDEEGYFVPIAHEIKKEINIPVIGVGGIKNSEKANKFIKGEEVDFVAIGRELLKNPDWIKDAREELS